jgi:hypothetical protein
MADSPPSPSPESRAKLALRLFRARKDRAFPPIVPTALLPIGDSAGLAYLCLVVLRLPGKSNSDSILNGERGFG